MRNWPQITLAVMAAVVIFTNASIFAQTPAVSSTTPAQNELGCAASVSITVTFDTDMDAATFNSSTFVVNARTTGLHQGTFTYDATNRAVTFDPDADFAVGEVVTVVLTTGVQSASSVPLSKAHIWSFTIEVPAGIGEYEPGTSYAVGLTPTGVTAADVDNDGVQDVIVCSKDRDRITVFLGNGDGSLTLKGNYYAGNGPIELCAADLNGDGDIDVAVVNKWSDDAYILRGNGDGSFSYLSRRGVGNAYSNPYSVFPGDFDGDGDLDLVTANSGTDNISIMKNDGNGYFGYPVIYSVGEFPATVTGGDLDGDGDIDLAVQVRVDNSIAVLLNNGDGSFAPRQSYGVGENPVDLFLADLDIDGDLDIAVANAVDDNMSVLINYGDGTFADDVVYAVGGDNPQKVFATDYDGDGDLDVATSNSNSQDISILYNDGDGTFSDIMTFSVIQSPNDIYSCDLDGDGDMDLAILHSASRTLSIWLSQSYWGSICGYVTSDATAVYGVPVDIYNDEGTPVGSYVTDETGWYESDSLALGDYIVTIVTPLGYLADSETKGIYVGGFEEEVSFELTALEVQSIQRSRGYWAHQLYKALSGRPQDYTIEEFSHFGMLIEQHFYNNLINPVEFYYVPQPATQADSMEVMRQLLHMGDRDENYPFPKRIARAQLLALMLNIVSGKVHQMSPITADELTISQTLTYCDLLLNDEMEPITDTIPGYSSGSTEWYPYIVAGYILHMANVGLEIPAGLVPSDIDNIAYRLGCGSGVPSVFSLSQNYPNPFNPETEIHFTLPHRCRAKVEIFNVIGQRVATVVDGQMSAGHHTVVWKASRQASGIYLYRLTADEFVESKKMMLVK